MRKFILMAGLVGVGIACSSGADMLNEMLDGSVPDAGAQTPDPVAKFVGYTDKAYSLAWDGVSAGGLFTTYAACQADFGASARICRVAEVLDTLDLPPPPPPGEDLVEGGAWVLGTDTVPRCWSDAGSTDVFLGTTGEFRSRPCYHTLVLACCTVN